MNALAFALLAFPAVAAPESKGPATSSGKWHAPCRAGMLRAWQSMVHRVPSLKRSAEEGVPPITEDELGGLTFTLAHGPRLNYKVVVRVIDPHVGALFPNHWERVVENIAGGDGNHVLLERSDPLLEAYVELLDDNAARRRAIEGHLLNAADQCMRASRR
jgi:hypothetical protein